MAVYGCKQLFAAAVFGREIAVGSRSQRFARAFGRFQSCWRLFTQLSKLLAAVHAAVDWFMQLLATGHAAFDGCSRSCWPLVTQLFTQLLAAVHAAVTGEISVGTYD